MCLSTSQHCKRLHFSMVFFQCQYLYKGNFDKAGAEFIPKGIS
jgi:hypothetical protein